MRVNNSPNKIYEPVVITLETVQEFQLIHFLLGNTHRSQIHKLFGSDFVPDFEFNMYEIIDNELKRQNISKVTDE